MPQTTYLPLYTATYPILAKVQKPGGVTVSSTVGAGDVPNKPTYVAGTIQSVALDAVTEETPAEEEQVEETSAEEEQPEEEQPEDEPPTRSRRRR